MITVCPRSVCSSIGKLLTCVTNSERSSGPILALELKQGKLNTCMHLTINWKFSRHTIWETTMQESIHIFSVFRFSIDSIIFKLNSGQPLSWYFWEVNMFGYFILLCLKAMKFNFFVPSWFKYFFTLQVMKILVMTPIYSTQLKEKPLQNRMDPPLKNRRALFQRMPWWCWTRPSRDWATMWCPRPAQCMLQLLWSL